MNRPYFVFEITPRCTSDCLYCYNVWKQDSAYPQGELTFAGIQKLFDKIAQEVKPLGVTLTGGEPLLHPDILETVSFLSSSHIPVGIATNGILLGEEMAQELTKRGVDYFEISLPALDRQVYGSLTGNGKINDARNALIFAKRAGAKLVVSIVITSRNISEIGEVINLAFSFSADFVSLNRFVPGGNGMKHASELQLEKVDLETALSAADKKSAEFNMPVNVTIPVESCLIDQENYPNLNFGSCVCGGDKWTIDPLGNLRTCEQNPEILGNLFEKSFREMAESRPASEFRRETLRSDCSECGRFRYCGGGCRFIRTPPDSK